MEREERKGGRDWCTLFCTSMLCHTRTDTGGCSKSKQRGGEERGRTRERERERERERGVTFQARSKHAFYACLSVVLVLGQMAQQQPRVLRLKPICSFDWLPTRPLAPTGLVIALLWICSSAVTFPFQFSIFTVRRLFQLPSPPPHKGSSWAASPLSLVYCA
jgi:hypothetical protein